MASYRNILSVVFLLLLVAGCATSPAFVDVHNTIPEIEDGDARIYFYRSINPFGIAVRPSVMLNGRKVGVSVANGVFFEDVRPGKYEVSLTTDAEEKISFVVNVGKEKFVRTSVGFGANLFHLYPELVESKVGRKAIQNLAYIGKSRSQNRLK